MRDAKTIAKDATEILRMQEVQSFSTVIACLQHCHTSSYLYYLSQTRCFMGMTLAPKALFTDNTDMIRATRIGIACRREQRCAPYVATMLQADGLVGKGIAGK